MGIIEVDDPNPSVHFHELMQKPYISILWNVKDDIFGVELFWIRISAPGVVKTVIPIQKTFARMISPLVLIGSTLTNLRRANGGGNQNCY